MSSVTGSVLPSFTAKAVALSLVSLPNSYLTFNLPLRNNALSILLISALKVHMNLRFKESPSIPSDRFSKEDIL